VRRRRKEYIEELYAANEPMNEWNKETATNNDEPGPDKLSSEIEAAFEELKLNKSEGIGNISSRDDKKPR
jgi:hypothetical protein